MGKVKEIEGGKHILDTYLPQKMIKPIWLELHKEISMEIANVLKSASFTETDTRVVHLILHQISHVLDMDKRKEIREKLKKTLAERLDSKTHPNLTNEMKGKIITETYLEIEEDITDYLDTAFGISHHVAIGLD
jgi:hypothetical protein